MEENVAIYTDAFLDAKRLQADPLADGVVADIIESGQTDLINVIFRTLRTNAGLNTQDFPPILANYFAQASRLPEWTDHDKLAKGAEYFADYGLKIVTLLMYKSLPSAYVCPKGARVLAATGRLEEFQGSTAKFTRRLMETAQFVLDVSVPGAFAPTGRAIESAMKVRLMHAATRYYIKRGDGWDTAVLGEPINQEDKAGTMLSFSALTREGLDTMGVKYNPELAEGYYHIWQVVGYLMGLDPTMIPAHEPDGHTLGWKILRRQMGASQDGKDLTKAVVDFSKESIPGRLFDHLPEVFIRMYSGDEIADYLGVRKFGWFWSKFMPSFINFFISKLENAGNVDGPIHRAAVKLSRHLLQYSIDHYYHHRKVEFSIPPSLQAEWGLVPAAKGKAGSVPSLTPTPTAV